jgi:histidinol-phosphate aminotransferase
MTMQDSSSKLLFLCSPNNPTGNLMNSELVEELLHSFNGIVVIDEAYNDFTAHQSYSKRLNEFPNLAVVQTLSKAYGMAGIRLGVCLANAEIISILNAIKPPYNVNLLTQNFAAKRLSEPAVIRSEIESIIKERAFLAQELQKFTFIKKIFPSDANFLLVRVDDATLRYDQLLRKGIVVRNRSSQPGCEETLRITVGTSAENKYLVNVLEEL